MNAPTAQSLPPLMQDSGVPFDMFIQALTEQLDRAQASMALKARVGKLPLTFAVKEVSLDLHAFVRIVNDDVYLRPAGPGDTGASSIKLALTTITRSMVEENAMNFTAEDPKFSLRQALGDRISNEDERSLERLGIRSVGQLNELRQSAGADVVARLTRMPVNRLQQAMLAASAPRVTRVTSAEPDVSGWAGVRSSFRADAGNDGGIKREAVSLPGEAVQLEPPLNQVQIEAPMLRGGRLPIIRAGGMAVPIIEAQDQKLVLQPLAHQMGCVAELDFGDGQVASMRMTDGSIGQWHPNPAPDAERQPL